MSKRPTACSTANRARPGASSAISNLQFSIVNSCCNSPIMNTRLLGSPPLALRLPRFSRHRRLPPRRPQKPTSPSSWLKPPPTQPGQSREPFRRLEELVRQPSPGVRKQLEAGLVRLLAPASTFEARRFACKQLGIIGSKPRSAGPERPVAERRNRRHRLPGPDHLPARQSRRNPSRRAPFRALALPASRSSTRSATAGMSKAVKLLAQSAGDADLSVAKAALAVPGQDRRPGRLEGHRRLPQRRRPRPATRPDRGNPPLRRSPGRLGRSQKRRRRFTRNCSRRPSRPTSAVPPSTR